MTLIQYPVKPKTGRNKDKGGVFQYPRPPLRALAEPGSKEKPAGLLPEGPRYIQGKRATDLEWNTWQGLKRAGWKENELRYQKGFLGGRFFKGGVVADIVVETRPLPTVIFVNSEYWHMGEMSGDDIIDMIRFDEEYGNFYNPPVYLFQPDVISEEAAFYTILQKVGYR